MGSFPAIAVFFVVMACLPLFVAPLNLSVIGAAMGFAVAGLGMAVAFSSAGMLALAQPASMYVSLIATQFLVSRGWNFVACIVLVPIAAAAISLPLGWLTSRLDVFAFAVLGFAWVGLVSTLASGNLLIRYTGGELGLPVAPASIGGFELNARLRYLLIVGVSALMLVLARRLMRGGFGRALLTMREDDVVPATLGISAPHFKVALAVVVGYLGAIGGVLVGQATSYAAPAQFDPLLAIGLLAVILAGGARHALGPFVGSLLLLAIPDLMTLSEADRDLVKGLVLVVVLIVSAGGILSALDRAIAAIAGRR